MNNVYFDIEYRNIVSDILENEEFKKLEDIRHHGSNRLDHVIRVSYSSYKKAKKLGLDYKSVARAGLLHDFFLDSNEHIKKSKRVKLLYKHPKYALTNALKYFELNDKEKDIILTHMFPIGFNIPKYIESWLVDIVDDYIALMEKVTILYKQLSSAFVFLFILLINNL